MVSKDEIEAILVAIWRDMKCPNLRAYTIIVDRSLSITPTITRRDIADTIGANVATVTLSSGPYILLKHQTICYSVFDGDAIMLEFQDRLADYMDAGGMLVNKPLMSKRSV